MRGRIVAPTDSDNMSVAPTLPHWPSPKRLRPPAAARMTPSGRPHRRVWREESRPALELDYSCFKTEMGW